MTNNSNEKDILALEAMSELKNYNSYTFKLIADSITSKNTIVLDLNTGSHLSAKLQCMSVDEQQNYLDLLRLLKEEPEIKKINLVWHLML